MPLHRLAIRCRRLPRHAADRLPGGAPKRLLATPCRSRIRIESLETPSLSHVAPSGVSERYLELLGFPPVSMSLPPCCAPLELRPLPSAGVTRLLRYYEPLRHPAGPGWSSRFPGWRVRATDGASRVAAVSLFTHAAASTPAEPVGARVARFPTAVSLPRINGGSASALPVSRPAQRSLRVAACVLAESPTGDPSSSECFSAIRYLPAPLRLLPAGATVAGRDSHPLGHSAFPRRTLNLG